MPAARSLTAIGSSAEIRPASSASKQSSMVMILHMLAMGRWALSQRL